MKEFCVSANTMSDGILFQLLLSSVTLCLVIFSVLIVYLKDL